MSSFGEFLIQRRKEMGRSQQELADAGGLSQPTVLEWENGRGTPRSVVLKDLFWILRLSDTEMVCAVHLLGER